MHNTNQRGLAALATFTFIIASTLRVFAQNDLPAAAPKFLHDASGASNVVCSNPKLAVEKRAGGVIAVGVKGGGGYPGFAIRPADGKAWDLSPWGHVKMRVANTGAAVIGISLRVDNAGRHEDKPWNTEAVSLKPGEAKELKVIFGHQGGFKPGYKLNPAAVTGLYIFVNDNSPDDRAFTVEDVQAGGPAGETPPVDLSKQIVAPKDGVILGKGVKTEIGKHTATRGKMVAAMSEKGCVVAESSGGKDDALIIKPQHGFWNLNNYHEVFVTLKNTGANPATPSVRVLGSGGSTDTVAAESPIAPGETRTIRVPFAAAKSWVGDPATTGKKKATMPGTGTNFESHRANGVAIFADAATTLEIAEIRAAATPVTLPAWVGTRPPVAGDWVKTFEDNFDGRALDLNRWNIYTSNFWDKRTHFTKDNAIVGDGKLTLRYEKKTGFQNDDENDKSAVRVTDFACGIADTYGKWTQRYGYFEARMKLPRASGLWPAFWTMPDRGADKGAQWIRSDTTARGGSAADDGEGAGGMEFDIMEHLTAWGPYRFNIAMHWDGYGKEHKAIGTTAYVPADADGFFTIGLLWLPGSAVVYGNGAEIARWDSPRVCDVQSYIILYMVSGGWANTPLDVSQLPADFVIDYVRVWQRADLATPADGAKPNDGGPKSMFFN